jgi:hypothetical protein
MYAKSVQSKNFCNNTTVNLYKCFLRVRTYFCNIIYVEGESRGLHKLTSGPYLGSDKSNLHPPSDCKAQYHKGGSWDSVVGRETELRAGYPRNLGSVSDRGNRLTFYSVRNGCKAQPFSYLISTGSSFPGHEVDN